MSLSRAIRTDIEQLVIQHPHFVAARARLEEFLEDHLSGLEPRIEVLIGPSRSGKTELLRALERKMPTQRIDGRLVSPILLVSVAAGTAPKDLPIGVIQALGMPPPRERMRAGELFNFMVSKLALAQVMLVLFDEASHLVDVGSHTPPRLASDWFKDLNQRAGVSIVLSGVYRLQQLIESNEQLRNRARKPINLRAYRWDVPEDRRAFAGCVQAFVNVLSAHQCRLVMEMNQEALLRHLYAASAGHLGLLANVFRELARQVSDEMALTEVHFASATAKLNLPGNGIVTPFDGLAPKDEQLMHVLSSEMARYDVILPAFTPAAELGNTMASMWREIA